jgi:large subunit ribosomal protein L17
MKHRVVGRRLDRTTEHRTAMFRNMVTSLLRHERIVTTTPKAKEMKRFADKIITLGKKGTSHAWRIAARDVRDPAVLAKLFGTLKERYASRPGGYTRVVRVHRRHGDNAEMAVIELVDRATEAAEEPEAKGGKAARPAKGEAKAPKEEKKEEKKAKSEKTPKKGAAAAEKASKPKAKKAAKGE